MNSTGTVAHRDVCFDIVEHIAELENTSPTNLPPLYDVIDPDHLNSLLESEKVQIVFSYYGYQITLTSEGVQLVSENPEVETEF